MRTLLFRTRLIVPPSTRLARRATAIVALAAVVAVLWAGTRGEWSSLSSSERETLAPLSEHWPDMRTTERRYYRSLAADAALVPREERARVSEKLVQWHALEAQQRREARAAYERYRALTEEQRHALLARWEAEQASAAAEAPANAAGETPSIDTAPSDAGASEAPAIPAAPPAQ